MIETLNLAIETSTIFRVLLLGFASFILSMLLTPIYTTVAYKREWWKKPRKDAVTGNRTVYQKLHAQKHRRHIPHVAAGLVFVASDCYSHFTW